MGKEIITFVDIEVENKFHHRKNVILLEDVDIKKYKVPIVIFYWLQR